MQIPISYSSGGAAINALIFSIDYDERLLVFDHTDADVDGIPDAVLLNLPPAFGASVTYSATDSAGEIDIFIADVLPPLATLNDSVLLTVTLRTAPVFATTTASVAFAQNPSPSFGDSSGASVAGVTSSGSVQIQVASSTVTPTPTPTNTPTNMPVNTATPTNTLVNTATPTNTPTNTPVNTATPTNTPVPPTPTNTPTPTPILYTLQGTLFEDRDSSGAQDQGEPGIAEATVHLVGQERRAARQAWTTTTDQDGTYRFTNIPRGTYQFGYELPPPYGNPGIQWSELSLTDPSPTVILPIAATGQRASLYLPLLQR